MPRFQPSGVVNVVLTLEISQARSGCKFSLIHAHTEMWPKEAWHMSIRLFPINSDLCKDELEILQNA